ncbi:type II secretion system F family protein [Novosphingobium piscinae]|uniref:Type II secretion system F family protein n=1 Tax=Novosphingobium piscinae TaxID=1507448 RepID=A0A7X1KRQ4_9SPHN|nr:type II secretion system F family protein [Novosphingobium piscinae]MBC2670828.1 type II secretion system F family protein [Novosphingobium piscinae]
MNLTTLLVLAFGAVLVLGMGLAAFSGPNPAKHGMRRLQAVRFRHSENEIDRVEAQLKKAVAARRPPPTKVAGSASRTEALALRLHRTGMDWTVHQYVYASLGLSTAIAFLVFMKSGAPVLSLFVGLIVGLGFPHMAVGYCVNKRIAKFNARFPDAIELLVRGLRSGLPVTETLGIVSSEVPGPVGEEFKLVSERIKIGKTMEDALQDTANRLGTPEFQFFCITLAIQRETGGNLAETLSNLADVLRKRAQMKLKIRAMSSESKASAYIVGALPFVVFGLIWMVNPQYVQKFFIDERLIVAGLFGLFWMSIGALVMAKMVNFEI